MRFFVTGGSGFVGSNLLLAMARQGHEVVSYDVRAPRYELPEGITRVGGDLLDRDMLREAVEAARPEVVLHLGARTDLHGASEADYRANTEGTANVIDAVAACGGAPHTVYASSRLVFAIDHRPSHLFDYKPSTAYGASKITMERIVRDRASEAGTWTMVRPTSLWGPYFEVPYRDFFDSVRRGRYVNVRGRSPRKSFGYVGNAVHELLAIASAPRERTHEQVLWLSDYRPLELGPWARMIAERFQVAPPRTVPYSVLRAAAKVGDLAQRIGVREPPITSFRLNNLLNDMVYDTSSTEKIVGPLPYSLEDGVAATVNWILEERVPQPHAGDSD